MSCVKYRAIWMLSVLLMFALTVGCAGNDIPDPGAPKGKSAEETGAVQPSSFEPSQLLKSDIDSAAEFVQRRGLIGLRTMMLKLYKRNPAYWRKHSSSAEQAVGKVFDGEELTLYSSEFGDNWAGDVVNLAFDPEFGGDRVRALVVGLLQMFMASYDNETKFYFTTDLEPQRLYNCARNFERAAWLLNTKHDPHGRPYLIANSMDGDQINLSIERIFGSIIALQDVLAEVTAEEQNRTIKNVVQSVTTFFLPI